MRDVALRAPGATIRRIVGATPRTRDDSFVWEALLAWEAAGFIGGIVDLRREVHDRLITGYRRLWYVDGGLWGPRQAERRAVGIVSGAKGHLFEAV